MILASVNLLSVILFFVALGLLISIHELGHLLTAKLFNVYCFEYSLGFGPKIFQKKGKGGETDYSIRAIPLGGYVAMFGETETIPEGVEVDPNRSLLAIKKWKRAIIMAAGVVLNFVLGFILMLSNTLFFPQSFATNKITVQETINEAPTLAFKAGLKTGDEIISVERQYLPEGLISEDYPLEKIDVSTYDDLWNKALAYVVPQNEDDVLNLTLNCIPVDNQNETNPEIKSYTFILRVENTQKTVSSCTGSEEIIEYKWATIGISNYTYQKRLGFFEAIKTAGKDWWEAATAIAEALGQLFIGKGFENLGGPVAILTTSSTALEIGFGTYLWLWGMISVNLGIFNLLPFPGLDGWHLLVVTIEGITKKEIPAKVKNIVSLVGMIILFAFMGFVFIKDIVGLF